MDTLCTHAAHPNSLARTEPAHNEPIKNDHHVSRCSRCGDKLESRAGEPTHPSPPITSDFVRQPRIYGRESRQSRARNLLGFGSFARYHIALFNCKDSRAVSFESWLKWRESLCSITANGLNLFDLGQRVKSGER